MRPDKPNTWLYLLLFACIGAGLATLMPFRGASEASILGYRSLCTFAPHFHHPALLLRSFDLRRIRQG